MQSVPPIFPVLGGYIVDGSLSITKTYPTTGILGNIGYEFSVTMYIEQLRTISGNTGNGVVIFDTSYIKPGQWILQSNGNCFLITTINVITDSNNISINLRDVDLFNAYEYLSSMRPGIIYNIGFRKQLITWYKSRNQSL